jgi:hypothetical protein
MLIKLLRNPAIRFGCNLTEGQTGNVGESLGQQLVGLGVAVEITEAAPIEIRGVDPDPEIADATKPEIAGPLKSRNKRNKS